LMILEVFSNLNDSMILSYWVILGFHKQGTTGRRLRGLHPGRFLSPVQPGLSSHLALL